MGAMRSSRVVEGPNSQREGRAPISGVRARVRPEEMEAPAPTAPVAAPVLRLVAPVRAALPSVEPGIEDAVPLSGDAALAAIFFGTVALAGAWVAAFSLL